MATWSGTITINPNSPVLFYRAVNKKGKTDISDETNTSFIHTSRINITIKTPSDTLQKSNKTYIKVNADIISALEKIQSSNKDIKTSVNIIKSTPTYMIMSSFITKKDNSSVSSAYQGPSNIYDTKSVSGTIKAAKKAKIDIYETPGGAVKYTTYASNPKNTKWNDKNIQTRYYGGKCYVKITSTVLKEMNSRLGVSSTKYVGCWVVTGGDITLNDTKGNNATSSFSKPLDKLPENATGTVGPDDVIMESTTVNFAEGSESVDLNTNSTLKDLMSNSMNGIFGLPYQWMPIADRRIDGSEFGRKYAEKIVARMPLLFLTPGRPAFLNGASREQKNNIISEYFSNDKDVSSDLISTLLGDAEDSGVSRYYTMNFAYAEYYRYVDVCCQVTAKLLGLDKIPKSYPIKINGESITDFSRYNWSKSLNGNFSEYFSSANSIPFYINANVSVNESINNDTMESSLAGSVKSKQEQAKELSFLLNSAGSATNNRGLLSKAVNSTTNLLTNTIPNAMANSSAANMISSINNAMGSIAAGGSMMFPELWSSSSMGRSYQVDIKLRSPDGDALSIYLNVLVPLYHLMCLAAPQMMNDNYNVYFSPFLVKGYCKSMFNIEMGIITGMDIAKGREGDWNANGLPTSIDVSITIKDLYDVFCLTPYSDATDLLNPAIVDLLGKKSQSTAKKIVRNTAMMDYLCNNAGLNLNNNEVVRQITVYNMLRANSITNWPNNKWLELQEFVDNKLSPIYKTFNAIRDKIF